MSLNTLTVGDIAEVEDKSGQPFAALGDSSAPKGKLMQAIAFVIKRKEDPKFTYEMAGKMNMEEINALLESDPFTKD